MKSKICAKIAIASALCAPSCAVEHGVVICRDESWGENALYVNLIRMNKAKQKPLHDQSNEIFDADRKLFFADSAYMEPFTYVLTGDTISFYNPKHETFLDMGNDKTHVRDINGVREREIIKSARLIKEYQK